jgi:exodeoxyribonuclease VII small subunit
MSEQRAHADGHLPVGELGYAQASAELERIVAELDEGLVDVDVLEVRFRRAIEIVEELDRRIRGARERVDALMPRLDALSARAEPPGPDPS